MSNAALLPTQIPVRLSGQSFRLVLACSAFLFIATQPCSGEEIYRWVDSEGKIHFSDTPRSAGQNPPLRAPKAAPTVRNTPNIPDDHYSVLNQVERMEQSRGKPDRARKAARKPGAAYNRGFSQGERPRYRSKSPLIDDFGYDGWESYNNLGPRTDLTRFQYGHPVYSPRLGFPSESRRTGGGHGYSSYQERPYGQRRYRGSGGALSSGRSARFGRR